MAPDETISSTRNPAVQAAVRLHRARHRRETGLTLLEGPAALGEAVAAGFEVGDVFVLPGEPLPEGISGSIRVVTPDLMEHLAGTVTPRGPVAVVAIPGSLLPEDRQLLVAWGISDPGNCGSLIRSAAAFGYGFAAGPGSADPWSPKVLRSAAGGHFRTTIGRVGALAALAGRTLVGTVVTGGIAPGPLASDAALLIGNEARGLPDDILAACDTLVTIPMIGGTESLNAGVAGAIVAYLGSSTPQH